MFLLDPADVAGWNEDDSTSALSVCQDRFQIFSVEEVCQPSFLVGFDVFFVVFYPPSNPLDVVHSHQQVVRLAVPDDTKSKVVERGAELSRLVDPDSQDATRQTFDIFWIGLCTFASLPGTRSPSSGNIPPLTPSSPPALSGKGTSRAHRTCGRCSQSLGFCSLPFSSP